MSHFTTSLQAYTKALRKAVEGLRRKAKEGQPYQVVLMDVQMPVLDGYEATKLLRKDELEDVRKVLVIAMTASAISFNVSRRSASNGPSFFAFFKIDISFRRFETADFTPTALDFIRMS